MTGGPKSRYDNLLVKRLARSARDAVSEVGGRAGAKLLGRERADPRTGKTSIPLSQWLVRGASTAGLELLFAGLTTGGRLIPGIRRGMRGIEVTKDLHYRPDGTWEHALDVYRPAARDHRLPTVLYIHGGGFRILSKESHWIAGMMYARRGTVVVNANYRLAPHNPFPAAVEDVCDAWEWTLNNAALWGGDPERVVIAGDSAGANLSMALTLCTLFRFEADFARRVYDLGVVPKAVLPACGIFQASDVSRFVTDERLPGFVRNHLAHITAGYVPDPQSLSEDLRALADPLLFLEQTPETARPLPSFHLTLSTGDPIAEDTRRLYRALTSLDADVELLEIPHEPHAYNLFMVSPGARKYWRQVSQFLKRTVGEVA